MKKYSIAAFLFIFSMTYAFAQTPVKSRKIKGEWELRIEVAEDLLPLGVHPTTSAAARRGFEAERLKLACSTGFRKHTSAGCRADSAASSWERGDMARR